ncbi:MAG: zinc-ribbon domain-containing protein [Ruminococcus sp.]|nr:zinc-ribbon domain-containing protein [Ruminococcus sp.]MCM1381842.1 zinc-ribbon domain-containing protein [Muribaculaceae bacterium]MCM1478857.1 zinc-ribbon domain-containing protein [Muribaculaceae bacterium]
MNIVKKLKNGSGGVLSVTENGDVISEGNFYILKDKKLKSGGQAVKIRRDDILRIGGIKYSSAAKLISSCSCFGVCGILYLIYKYFKSISRKAGYASKGTGFLSELFKGSTGDAAYIPYAYADASESAANISKTAGELQSVLRILIIILFVISVVQLIRYGLSHKKLVEVNTVYGSFCISRYGVRENDLQNFINCFHSLGTAASGLVCPECGAENPQGKKFCAKCGRKLSERNGGK